MRNTFGCLLARRATLAALAAALAAAGLGVAGSPTLAVAQADEAVTYVDETGAAHELAAGSYTDISDKSFEDKVGYGLADGWYVVRGNRSFTNRLTVTGDAKLVLCDGATANFTDGIRGYSGKLTIYAQSAQTGKLVATADGGEKAGIGGNGGEDNRTEIVICGGKIESTGADAAAGIGGGSKGACGKVKILGGDVTAIGAGHVFWTYAGGAGIGSGDEAKLGGRVEIAGGNVVARCEERAAGIGTGYKALCPVDVVITGGKVDATGGTDAAGIGGGYGSRSGYISISGGDVVAKSDATGIGGGVNGESDAISISGGNIVAIGGGAGTGIGGGSFAKTGPVTITGGVIEASVKKSPSDDRWAIGKSSMEPSGIITIPDDYRVVNCETSYVAEAPSRIDALSALHVKLEPCNHEEVGYEKAKKGHRTRCHHCLAEPGDWEMHQYDTDGTCSTCGGRYSDMKA